MLVETLLGVCAVGFENGVITKFWLPGLSKADIKRQADAWSGGLRTENEALAKKIQGYFAGEKAKFGEPVNLASLSPFAQKILKALRKVKFGETVTYGKLAEIAGAPKSARGVGAVMARNPIPLIIPCHRVLRSDGGIGGFSGPTGVALKIKMLKLEGLEA